MFRVVRRFSRPTCAPTPAAFPSSHAAATQSTQSTQAFTRSASSLPLKTAPASLFRRQNALNALNALKKPTQIRQPRCHASGTTTSATSGDVIAVTTVEPGFRNAVAAIGMVLALAGATQIGTKAPQLGNTVSSAFIAPEQISEEPAVELQAAESESAREPAETPVAQATAELEPIDAASDATSSVDLDSASTADAETVEAESESRPAEESTTAASEEMVNVATTTEDLGSAPPAPAAAGTPTQVRPIVLCGPSGSGKSTLLKKLFQEFPDRFGFSVSHTTRKPRDGEQSGVHYHFVDRETMLAEIAEGKFIENAEFSGNLYGTSFAAVSDVLDSKKNVILDIDSQGVELLKAKVSAPSDHPLFLSAPLYIFLAPPSVEELENRLRGRNTESEDSLRLRLETAKRELEWGLREGSVDVVVVNDDIDQSYKRLREAILGE